MPEICGNGLVPACTVFHFHHHIFLFTYFSFPSRGHFRITYFSLSFSIRYTARSFAARRSFSTPPDGPSEWGISPHLGPSVHQKLYGAPRQASPHHLLVRNPGIRCADRSAILRGGFSIFSGCRAAPAVKLRVRPTRSPAGGSRERAGGGRGGWWRGWWFGSRLRGVQGLCVPADLLATGNVFLGCGFPTFAFFGSGVVSRLRIRSPSAFSASATQFPVMLPLSSGERLLGT